jgi:Ni,Fe-hydrogenase III small subunit
MGLKTAALKKSIWVFHVACSPCNNCDIEILDLLTPRFDVERFGIILVGSPRHADALLITGVANRMVTPGLLNTYRATAKPCVCFLFGACACRGSIFKGAYNVPRLVDEILREEDPNAIIVYVPGCPPKPESMIAGVVKALKAL